jgi:hypothetical protein
MITTPRLWPKTTISSAAEVLTRSEKARQLIEFCFEFRTAPVNDVSGKAPVKQSVIQKKPAPRPTDKQRNANDPEQGAKNDRHGTALGSAKRAMMNPAIANNTNSKGG